MRLVNHREKWAVRIQGRRFSTGYDATEENREAAERAARATIKALTAQSVGDRCDEIVDAYFADMPHRAKPKELGESARYCARRVLAFFGRHTPDQVTRDECRTYIAGRKADGVSNSTILQELSILRAALRWRDPQTPAQFDMPRASPPRERWLTRGELDRLRAGAKASPHVELFIELAICTAGRKEALLGLTWAAHINFERRMIDLGFKAGGKGRATVPMTDKAYDALRKAESVATCPYVIEYGGRQVGDIKKALKRAYVRAGLDNVPAPAHTLRHTSGAYMAMGGVPLLEIKERMGHRSIQTTQRHYLHFCPDAMQASTKALEV